MGEWYEKDCKQYVGCSDGARTQPSKTYRGHTGSTYGVANFGMDVVRNFAMSTGSITVFGVSAVAHSLLIAGVAVYPQLSAHCCYV